MYRRNARKYPTTKSRQENSYETQDRGGTLSIYRPLDEEQAREIRVQMRGLLETPSATIVRGDSGSQEPKLVIIGLSESRAWNFLRLHNKDDIRSKLFDEIPSLTKPIDVQVRNIGRFGLNKSKVSIAASLELPLPASNERGSIQGVLCELNQWDPVQMYETYRAHVTLASMPGDTPEDQLITYKQAVSNIVEQGTVLRLGPAQIRT